MYSYYLEESTDRISASLILDESVHVQTVHVTWFPLQPPCPIVCRDDGGVSEASIIPRGDRDQLYI